MSDQFPADLSGLVVLDASHNRIKDIPSQSFKHLSSLVRLDLKGNLLDVIASDVFKPLASSLKALDLSSNVFSALPLEAIRAVDNSLETVRLEGKQTFLSLKFIELLKTLQCRNIFYGWVFVNILEMPPEKWIKIYTSENPTSDVHGCKIFSLKLLSKCTSDVIRRISKEYAK